MAYKIKTAAASKPITIEQARAHVGLVVGDASMDTLLNTLINAATKHAEDYLNRSLIETIWTYYLDLFETYEIEIDKLPVSSITSIKYYDKNNEIQTLDPSGYLNDIISEPARIQPAMGESWPTTYDKPNAIEIEFKAGYGVAAANVPQDIVVAILMLLANLFENRGDEGFRKLPTTIKILLDPYRLNIL